MEGMVHSVLTLLAQYQSHPDYAEALQRLRLALDEEQARLFREQPRYGHAGNPVEKQA